MKSNYSKLSRTKIEYMRCEFSTSRHDEEVSLDEQVVPQNDTFRYLRSMLQKDDDMDENVSHRIKTRMDKVMPSFSNKIVPQKVEVVFYRMKIQPSLLSVG